MNGPRDFSCACLFNTNNVSIATANIIPHVPSLFFKPATPLSPDCNSALPMCRTSLQAGATFYRTLYSAAPKSCLHCGSYQLIKYADVLSHLYLLRFATPPWTVYDRPYPYHYAFLHCHSCQHTMFFGER